VSLTDKKRDRSDLQGSRKGGKSVLYFLPSLRSKEKISFRREKKKKKKSTGVLQASPFGQLFPIIYRAAQEGNLEGHNEKIRLDRRGRMACGLPSPLKRKNEELRLCPGKMRGGLSKRVRKETRIRRGGDLQG